LGACAVIHSPFRLVDVSFVLAPYFSSCRASDTKPFSAHHPRDKRSQDVAHPFHSLILRAQLHSRSALLVYATPTHLAIRGLQLPRFNDTTATMRANCLPNVSVTIQVNGNNLPEHQVDSGDPTAGLSFVEAIDGAQFSIVLTVLPDYQHRDGDLELCVSLDGCKARSLTISSDWVKKGNNVIIIDSTHDYADGLASSRKFTFGKTKMSTYRLTKRHNKR
jgi:hypothetical protein